MSEKQHHLGQLALLLAHGGEADVLRGARGSAHASRVLLREEALGHDDVEVNVENAAADGHAQNEHLMAQHPAQPGGIFAVDFLEDTLAGARSEEHTSELQ